MRTTTMDNTSKTRSSTKNSNTLQPRASSSFSSISQTKISILSSIYSTIMLQNSRIQRIRRACRNKRIPQRWKIQYSK
ncbi:hypothetical protein X975_17721, partial [Stegodyphus mimosarum]